MEEAGQSASSPVPLLRFLLQARQQRVEAAVVAVQQAGRQLAQVAVVLLVEEGEGQVAPGSDVLQDVLQNVLLHHPLKLGGQPGEELHPDLQHRFSTEMFVLRDNTVESSLKVGQLERRLHQEED